MKASSRSAALLLLALSCALAGCRPRPQPPAGSGSAATGAGGSSGQTNAQAGTPRDEGTDAAAGIIAEAIRQRAAQRSLAQALSATPTPSLDDPFGTKGQPFRSFAGRFVITPPRGFPPFSQSTETAPDGVRERHVFSSEFPGRGSAIYVDYIDLKEGTYASPQQILESALDLMLKKGTATLEKQESLVIQDSPALSIYISIPAQDGGKPLYMRTCGVINAGRAYFVSYASYDRAELDGPRAQAFFKSFGLL